MTTIQTQIMKIWSKWQQLRLTEQEMTEMANLPFLFFALNLMVGAIMVPDGDDDNDDNEVDGDGEDKLDV